MSLATIQQPIEVEFTAFKEYYATLFRSNIPLLNRALSHVSRTNGKMMRPMLVLLTAKSVAGTVCECTNYAAAALELLHTASLLHDDVVDEHTGSCRQGREDGHQNEGVICFSDDVIVFHIIAPICFMALDMAAITSSWVTR